VVGKGVVIDEDSGKAVGKLVNVNSNQMHMVITSSLCGGLRVESIRPDYIQVCPMWYKCAEGYVERICTIRRNSTAVLAPTAPTSERAALTESTCS